MSSGFCLPFAFSSASNVSSILCRFASAADQAQMQLSLLVKRDVFVVDETLHVVDVTLHFDLRGREHENAALNQQ